MKYGINPSTMDGMWPRLQINGKFIAHETEFSIGDNGIIAVEGLVLDYGINVKTHRRAEDIIHDAINGEHIKLQIVDQGGITGDEHDVKIYNFNFKEEKKKKIYNIEFIAV